VNDVFLPAVQCSATEPSRLPSYFICRLSAAGRFLLLTLCALIAGKERRIWDGESSYLYYSWKMSSLVLLPEGEFQQENMLYHKKSFLRIKVNLLLLYYY
jgi:hypothetical protein